MSEFTTFLYHCRANLCHSDVALRSITASNFRVAQALVQLQYYTQTTTTEIKTYVNCTSWILTCTSRTLLAALLCPRCMLISFINSRFSCITWQTHETSNAWTAALNKGHKPEALPLSCLKRAIQYLNPKRITALKIQYLNTNA